MQQFFKCINIHGIIAYKAKKIRKATIRYFPDGIRCWIKLQRYFSAFIIALILTTFPTSLSEIQSSLHRVLQMPPDVTDVVPLLIFCINTEIWIHFISPVLV